jgi:hypothetical protein
MAIELVEDLKTVRTYPRLMKSKTTGNIALALSAGVVWLGGHKSDSFVDAASVNWENLEDHSGAITLWNKD